MNNLIHNVSNDNKRIGGKELEMVKEMKGDFKKGRWINDILDLVNNCQTLKF
jgi:hypothetical protein